MMQIQNQTVQPLHGLAGVVLEAGKEAELSSLLVTLGLTVIEAPAIREVANREHSQAIGMAKEILAGTTDLVIFMTGSGVVHLLEQLADQIDLDSFIESLARTRMIACGPKSMEALQKLGIAITDHTSCPDSWLEVLSLVDIDHSIAGRRVLIVGAAHPAVNLVAGLEARGATVHVLSLYRIELPIDVGPLDLAIASMIRGEVDAVFFTSSEQVTNLVARARQTDHLTSLTSAMRSRIVTCSIGPVPSRAIVAEGWPVDLTPGVPRLADLIDVIKLKLQSCTTEKRESVTGTISAVHRLSPTNDGLHPSHNSRFLRACRLEKVDRTPIWLMRQAGRYLPEYRRIREKVGFMELCKNPALSAEVMIATVERLGVDAAIIFSDLLPILEPMGMDLEFSVGEGPVIHNPIREASDINRFLELEQLDALGFVMETVSKTRAGLDELIPLIGFAGAPFTLASYCIEGGTSRSWLHTKTLMYQNESAWHDLMARLARAVSRYLIAQLDSGAQVVQLFDSWVGCLSPEDYRRYVLPHSRNAMAAALCRAPVIHFATGNPSLLPLLAEAGGTVIGVDWRIGLSQAWRMIGHDRAIQGNLDPAVLLSSRETIASNAKNVLAQAAGRPGHIFNLGHGVLPQTPVDNVLELLAIVRDHSL